MKSLAKKLIILFVLGTTSVLPTLKGTFVFDDGEAILKNALVTQPETIQIKDIFTHDFWGVELTHPHSHKSYRPLTTLTYRWDYALWGKNAFPFHLTNLMIHGINCGLVYLFLKKCLALSFKRRTKYCEKIAFWAGIFFSVHPVHVEPLGSVVGRADLLSSFVFLIGFLIVPENRIFGPLVISFFAIFGSLFKENAIVLSIIYVALDFVLKEKFQLKREKVVQYLISIVLTVGFVVWRLWFQDGPPTFQSFDNPPVFADGTFTKIASVTYIWALNAFTLLCPIWLCYDWSMGCVRLVDTVRDFRFFCTILFLLVICYIVLHSGLKRRVIMTACVITAVTFLPSSNIVFVVGFVLAERNLYLPSIGYSLLIGYAFVEKKYFKLSLFVVLMFFARSVRRSTQWIDQGSLFKTGLDVCANNAKVHYNLGTLYGELGDYNLSEIAYKSAIKLRPDYYQAMNNLGNLIRGKKLLEAEYWLRKAVGLKHDFAAAWMNLGIVLSKKNQSEALICYKNGLRYRKVYPDCEYNLGNLYLDMGEDDLALQSWKRALALKPSHAQAWINSVILLEQQEKLEEAKQLGIDALKNLQDSDTMHFILANILGKLSEYETGKHHFENAIRICIKNEKRIPAKYYANLGVLYHRWGRKESAKEAYRRALNIDSSLTSARRHLRELIEEEPEEDTLII